MSAEELASLKKKLHDLSMAWERRAMDYPKSVFPEAETWDIDRRHFFNGLASGTRWALLDLERILYKLEEEAK